MTILSIKVKWFNPIDDSWNESEHTTDRDPLKFIQEEYMPDMCAEIVDAHIEEEATEIEYQCILEEKHPHLMEKSQMFWGYKEFIPFCDDLLMPARNDRQGFDFDTLQEIQLLRALHAEAHPEFEENANSWSDDYINMDGIR